MERLSATSYSIGDVVELYCGKFFICSMAGTTADSSLVFDGSSSTVIDGTVVWKPTNGYSSEASSSGAGIKTWKANESYKIGDVVIYGDSIYQCILSNSDNIFMESHWKQLSNTSSVDKNYVDYISSTLN